MVTSAMRWVCRACGHFYENHYLKCPNCGR